MRATEFLIESYKEIEFVCANPEFPNATDPVLQNKLFVELKKIPGVIPLYQDQSHYSEGQKSLTAIFKDTKAKEQILKLAKHLGVQIDLMQPVSDDYVDRAIRGEHEGQLNELFQAGKNWKWEFRGSEEAFASFKIGDVEYIRHAHSKPRDPKSWIIEFKTRDEVDQDKSFGLTGSGNAAEVMSTVVDITRAFLEQYKDNVMELAFLAKEQSRASLYAKMIKRLLPDWNLYQRNKGGTEFYLTNPKAYEMNK